VRRRAPLDSTGGRPTTSVDLRIACRIVDRSGVVPILSRLLDAEVGRHRTITVRGVLTACQLNAMARHHRAHLIEVARTINALTDEQRHELGFADHDPHQTYDRIDRLYLRLCEVLDARHTVEGVVVDAKWMANRLAAAAVPKEFRTSSSIAVDGTDVETWGALHGDPVTVDLDGEASKTQVVDGNGSTRRGPARRAIVLGIGPDGRKRYTVDPDARAGHRSATNSRPAGPFVGFELHLAVQTRDVRWTNAIDRVTLSDETPGVVTKFSLVPAGTHRGKAIVDDLIAARAAGERIDDVVWDPGYSLCRPATVHHKLARSNIHQSFRPVTHQRGARPSSGDALLIDGQLFSSMLPDELRDLAAPPRGASESDKQAYEAKFNLRARWRMARHAAPDADGATRWRCPFCAGFLRSRDFPSTMRRAATVPLVPATGERQRCCDGIQTAYPNETALWQRIPFGTTAWRISMGRRQVVESVNAALKGAFADLSRGFVRVMGTTKITVLLGFTLAAYNLDRIRSFRAKHHLDDDGQATSRPKQSRPRRRSNTWAELIDTDGLEPPPT
jgi:hypothetical protein